MMEQVFCLKRKSHSRLGYYVIVNKETRNEK